MAFRTHRRWLALLVAVALALGFATHGAVASTMDAKMMTTAAFGETAPMGSCDGCGGDADCMPATACYVLCSGTVAILGGGASLQAGLAENIVAVASPSKLGRDTAPDPHPPRPTVLS